MQRRSAIFASLPLLAAALMPAAACAAGETAQPEPAAQVWLAKAEQRRLGLRTRRADAPPSDWLPARVVADPRADLRVTVGQAGIVAAPPNGFPLPGQRVRAGQVLAVLHPQLSEPERRDLEAQLAVATRNAQLGRLQIDRFSINEAESIEVRLMTASMQILLDYRAAVARKTQLERALGEGVALTAPADGTLLGSNARANRVVAAGDALFELVAPGATAVEVLLDDEGGDDAVAADGDGRLLPLRRLGATVDPVSRRHRALYAIAAAADDARAAPAIGEPLRVRFAPGRERGWRLPARSIVEAGGRQWVWVHEDAERFVAQAVQVTALGADWVRIDAGLDASQRVVIDGASLLAARARRERVS